ncbi:Glutathione S-transferase zeta-1 [Dimargaris verticillata]|uniref:Glutathione S-transferase zeta-1 n=1 Tax=Dimargaris verticillata TaxID=2761393 RepID=A0A9W8B3R6_9FUNG|nr:Glutathione S-transferase zeta-1 [Dimargaris verticillata]
MASPTKPLLHHYFRSSCSGRVRIALNWKEINYDTRHILLLKGEQHASDYLAKNPSGLVPTLEIDGHVIPQSMAILEYLEDAYPDTPTLLPGDAAQRAKARAIAQVIASDIQPAQNMTVTNHIKDVIDAKPWNRRVIDQGFEKVEKMLQLSAGKYCVGDQVSVADVCLVPQVWNAIR